jgi:hypothetical protein
VIDARINQQYFESKQAPRLEQEINLHIKVNAKTVKQITNCVVFPVYLVVQNVNNLPLG